jgi:DNA-directed RNA polymerase alpha subunit
VKLEILNEEDGVLEAQLSQANEAIANTLRRSMMVKVPTLAIKELHINQNESGLFDEVLANRMGQIPLTIPENVDEDDTVHIAVQQEGPGAVHAEDIKADNDEAEPVNPEALIVELKEEQELTLEGEAVLSTGQEHAKHQGGTIGYQKTDDGQFVFRIESTSGYTNEELLEAGIQQVKEELDEFEEAVQEL